MIRRSRLIVLLLAAALVAAGCSAGWRSSHGRPADREVSAEIGFYFDDLSPYGTWVDVHPYGWIWCPLDNPVGWRPYTVGYWAYCDEGWLWVSEDPWGCIPYHYGRWTWRRDYGWFWVPGDVWAPAWVAWRYGPGWVGWAPLPPDVYWRPGIGLEHDHVVRRPLARAVIPARQQAAVRAFHNARAVVVPVFQGKDQLGLQEGSVAGRRARGRHSANQGR